MNKLVCDFIGLFFASILFAGMLGEIRKRICGQRYKEYRRRQLRRNQISCFVTAVTYDPLEKA